MQPIADISIPQHRPQAPDPRLLFAALDAASNDARELARNLRLAARQLSVDTDHDTRSRVYAMERHANDAAALSIRLGEEAAHWQRRSDAADKRRTA